MTTTARCTFVSDLTCMHQLTTKSQQVRSPLGFPYNINNTYFLYAVTKINTFMSAVHKIIENTILFYIIGAECAVS